MIVEAYSDGSSRTNPGPSGYGFIIRYWEPTKDTKEMPEAKTIEGSAGFRVSTNNRMEIMGGVAAIKCIMENIDKGVIKECTQINLASDSEYFVKAINQNWIARWQQNQWMTGSFRGSKPRPVRNQDLWEMFLAVQDELRKRNIVLTMFHIDGHSGHEFNERADRIAVAASGDSATFGIDEGYEKQSPYLNKAS